MDKYYTYDSRSWLVQSHTGDDWVRTSVFMSIRMDDIDSVKRFLPEPCRECMWRRGRVCALPRCQKMYWGLGDDTRLGTLCQQAFVPGDHVEYDNGADGEGSNDRLWEREVVDSIG